IRKDSPPVRLLSPIGAPGAYVASFGWVGQGTTAPDLNTVWTADSQTLSPGYPVTLTTQMPDGVRYEMKVAVDDGYLFTVDQRVINASGKPIAVRPTRLISKASSTKEAKITNYHTGPIAFLNGEANYKVDYKNLDAQGGEVFSNSTGWLGFTDKYWLTALA